MPPREFLLPDLGEGLEDAEIVEWHVRVGDLVAIDEPLVEVETAKANVELPSPFAGTVVALHGEPGDRIAVGAAIVTIEVAAGDEPAPARSSAPAGGEAPDRPLVGFGMTEKAPTATTTLAPPTPAAPATVPDVPAPATAARPRTSRALASPPVRKRARELGVDLSAVPGTGPHGNVTHADLERFVRAVPDVAPQDQDPDQSARIPYRGVRRAIAEKMITSRREIPDASSWVGCDATALLAAREQMNAGQSDVRVTPLALVLRACVAGLARYPRLNARLHSESEEIEELSAVHLGVAVQTPRGLVVPVIRDAHRRTTLELAKELQRIAAGARDGTLLPTELVGSTFTVSNYGAFGVDGGVAVINHPEVAILGVGRFVEKPWVVDGRVAPRTVVELSLSFDHRVMDGGDAGGFLRFVADCVEEPATLLAHL